MFRITNPDTLCGRITNAPELRFFLNFPKISMGMNDYSPKPTIFVKNNATALNTIYSPPYREGPGEGLSPYREGPGEGPPGEGPLFY